MAVFAPSSAGAGVDVSLRTLITFFEAILLPRMKDKC